MRAGLAITVALTLAACDSSSPPQGSSSGTPSPTSNDQTPGADEARQFILSKLEDVDSNGQYLTYSDVKLNDPWMWTATITSASHSDGMVVATTEVVRYHASPNKFRTPVSVIEDKGIWIVKTECAVADCITASGYSEIISQSILDKEPKTDKFDKSGTHSANYWWLRDKDSAERVAKAMNVLLTSQGAQHSSF